MPAPSGRPSRACRCPLIHADALYKPVPPVTLDDEGYICRDGRVSESTRHGRWLNYAVNGPASCLSTAYDLAVSSSRKATHGPS